jgi:starvation-inducible DNA-binding protein
MSDLFVTRISVPESVAEILVKELNTHLANTTMAQLMIKYAHWNVKGPAFFQTHKLFDEIYEQMVEATDRIGERITALGGVAEGLPEHIGKAYTLSTYTCKEDDADTMCHIEAVANVVSEVSNGLRGLASLAVEQKDLVTQGILLSICEVLDKYTYFLEAHLRA